MALNQATYLEVRSGGSDTNGGGWVSNSGNPDYSQQDGPILNLTDGACSATTTLTSTTGGFTSNMVGSILYLSSGPGWYEITAYTDTNTVTLDRAGPSASGMTVNVGGALASIGGLGAMIESAAWGADGCLAAWIQGGNTYTLTSGTANVSGGTLDLDLSGAGLLFSKAFNITGYTTTRGDNGRATISAGAQTPARMIMLGAGSNGRHSVGNLVLDGNNVAGSTGLIDNPNTTYSTCFNCHFTRSTGNGCDTINSCTACWAYDNAGAGFTGSHAWFCRASNNTGHGYETVNSTFCIADNNGDAGFQGLAHSHNSIAYKNTNEGWDVGNSRRGTSVVNSIAYGNGSNGFDWGSSTTASCGILWNCAAGGNTPADVDGLIAQNDLITLTQDPFVDGDNGDFRLNDVAGGGALCKRAGIVVAEQQDVQDIGAVHVVDYANQGPYTPRVRG